MKLLYLGTGAPDWYKAVDYIRHKTAMLIGDDLLIDPGPDVPEMMRTFCADFAAVRHILVSHAHGDHWDPQTAACFPGADIYGPASLASAVPDPARFHALTAGQAFTAGPYTVLPVPANHAGTAEAFHFAAQGPDGKRFFYGHDGVWFTSAEFALLRRFCAEKGLFDAMSFDATVNGMGDDGRTAFFDRFETDEVGKGELTAHNNAAMCIALRDVCRDVGIAGPETVCFCAHLAWHGYPDAETPRRIFEPHGFIVPDDGFRMEI